MQDLQKILLRRTCEDTEIMTRVMITESKQRAVKEAAWNRAQTVLAGKKMFCTAQKLLLFSFLFIVPFLSGAPLDNAGGYALKAADVEECSLAHLAAPLSLWKDTGSGLTFSNEFLKATFPAQVFVSQRKAPHVLKRVSFYTVS